MPPMHKSQPESHRGSASPRIHLTLTLYRRIAEPLLRAGLQRRRGTGRKNMSKKHRPPLGYRRICIAPDGPGAHPHSSPHFQYNTDFRVRQIGQINRSPTLYQRLPHFRVSADRKSPHTPVPIHLLPRYPPQSTGCIR